MRLGLYLSIAAATLTACSETTFFKDNSTPPGEPAGTILGRVCDPSGRHWLPDAMAYANLIDGSGKLYDTRKSYTDRDGYFLLDDMPAGRQRPGQRQQPSLNRLFLALPKRGQKLDSHRPPIISNPASGTKRMRSRMHELPLLQRIFVCRLRPPN